MIIIDGCESNVAITSFANLEELLVSVTADESLQSRIVTDVFLNGEQFSELYPHQAEDIDSSEIESVEIITVQNSQMALSIVNELYTVINIMQYSSKKISEMLRELDNSALSILSDTVDVTRDFMNMVAVLRSEFVENVDENFALQVESISKIIGEINEVLASEDWFLLADLLEFEFVPACQIWEEILKTIEKDIKAAI